MPDPSWLLLLYSLPARHGAARVSLWRKLQRTGALPFKASAYLLPDTPAHLELFQRSVDDIGALIAAQDVVMVGGGNTANMLAIWRLHGVDLALRDAYAQGTILTGWSAGCICWFEAGITDSFTPELGPLHDGLGILRGSACPHYDSEERRPIVYAREIAAGLAPGIALDDGVVALYEDERLVEVVSARPDGRAFRVDRDGAHALPIRPVF